MKFAWSITLSVLIAINSATTVNISLVRVQARFRV